jgi:hypothetical protein
MADDNYVGIHEKTPVSASKKRDAVLNKVKAVAKLTTASELKCPYICCCKPSQKSICWPYRR